MTSTQPATSDLVERLQAVLAGRYELVREIGAGAMAIVFLARDLRHGRRVAIKVLRPGLAARLGNERFVQEITVTAGLQHPSILPLYDSGAADDLLYYVMPFVEGESLRTKIEREGQMGVEDTIAIAVAVAAALEYAHERGIVHRDIKPENVLLQRGQTFVADFGIALAVSVAGGERITDVGLSVGTPHYMSPEQAAGDRIVDARSDIYSLGAITYEMLTGSPPHPATSVQTAIARILSEKPAPIAQSRDLVPANVDAAVRRALAKSPADRFARASQFADALRDASFRLPVTGRSTGARVITAPDRRTLLLAAAACTVLAVGLLAGWSLRAGRAPGDAPANAPPKVFYLPLDSGAAVPGYPVLSPDGSQLVYPAGDGGSNRLFLRRLADPTPVAIPRTEGANNAFFSPDGQWVGFLADQSLKKVRLADGSDAIIAPYVEGLAGATWREDGLILFAAMPKGSLFEVRADSGPPKPLVVAAQRLDSGYYFPQFLPGGRMVLYNTESTGGSIGIIDLVTGSRRLVGRGLRPSFLESGHLVFADAEGRLAVQRFDLRRRRLEGAPVVLPEELAVGRGRAFYSVSRGGTLAIIRAGGTALDLALFDRDGGQQVLLRNGGFWAPRFSPDGTRLVFGDRHPDDLWIHDLATQTRRRFTLDGASNNDAVWSPDGQQIGYAADRPFGKDVLVRATSGAGEARALVVRQGLQWPSDWTSSGDLVFTDVALDEDRDIWTVRADGSAGARVFLDTPFLEKGGDVSPDGRWIAYDSNAPGRFEVFVSAFPEPSASPLIVSIGGGRNPRWSADGRELFYWHDDRLVSARLDLAPRPRVVRRTTVLRASYADADHPNYDVHPDGRRFAIVTGRARPQRIIVALDPFARIAPRER